MITINKIVGRLLLLNHINAEEAVLLLGGLYGQGETETEIDSYEGEDEGYYAKKLDEEMNSIEPITDEEMDAVLAEVDKEIPECNCFICKEENLSEDYYFFHLPLSSITVVEPSDSINVPFQGGTVSCNVANCFLCGQNNGTPHSYASTVSNPSIHFTPANLTVTNKS